MTITATNTITFTIIVTITITLAASGMTEGDCSYSDFPFEILRDTRSRRMVQM